MNRRLLLALAVLAVAAAAWLLGGSAGGGRRDRAGESRITSSCARSERPSGGDRAAGSARRVPGKTVRDAALRNETRELLRERLGERFPAARPSATAARAARKAAPAAAPPPDPSPAPAPAGTARIDPKYIRERVREDFFPLAKECYQGVLERHPERSGKVALHFTIVGDERIGGIVEEATVGDESTLRDDEFDTCMTESMMSMTFPPPKGGGSVTVVYPIEFSPGDDDEGDAGGAGERRGEDAGAKR